MYEDQTKETILDRMLELIPSELDKRQGSIIYDMLSPASIELALAYINLGLVLDKGFANTAYGEFLDRRASELGVYRKESVKSKGFVTVKGVEGTVIAKGQRFSTDTAIPIYFVSLEDVVIGSGGTIKVAIEAEEAGASGNVAANTIILTVGNITGVTNVTNELATDGGADEESDSSLYARYNERIATPSASGNAAEYRKWAKEVNGVADAKVYPLWNGSGTVKVIVLDSNYSAPTPQLKKEVEAYIESQRPVGAEVTVAGAVEVPINITIKATLTSYGVSESVKASIQKGLTAYFSSLAFKDALVRYTQIQRVILDVSEIVDYSELLVNGGTSNIEITDGEVAVLGEVVVNVERR